MPSFLEGRAVAPIAAQKAPDPQFFAAARAGQPRSVGGSGSVHGELGFRLGFEGWAGRAVKWAVGARAWSVRERGWLGVTCLWGRLWGPRERRLGRKAGAARGGLECCGTECGCQPSASTDGSVLVRETSRAMCLGLSLHVWGMDSRSTSQDVGRLVRGLLE